MFAAKNELFTRPSGGYQISRSLRFNSADSAYLNRTPATTTNRQIWTWSGWVKRGKLGVNGRVFQAREGSTGNQFFLRFSSTDTIFVTGDSGSYTLETTQVFRDPSAWYHIVFACDTTQATSSNRFKLYVNGSQVTAFGTATYPSQNLNTTVNSAFPHGLGAETSGPSEFFDGYITETYLIDGQALTPSSFGETNAQTGVWQPKAYSGSYGTNGFYLNFSDNSNTTAATLGKDYSGNGNNWTPNNFSVTAGVGNDSMVDSPTSYGTDTGVGGTVRGNYATLNPVAVPSAYVSTVNGNLQQGTVGGGATQQEVPITFAFNFSGSNKWYAEVNVITVAGTYYPSIGISPITKNFSPINTQGGNTTTSTAYMATGEKYNSNALSAYGSSFTNGDVIGIAVDEAAGTVVMYKNNVSQGTLVSSLTGLQFLTVTAHNSTNFYFNAGQRPFAYTAPSGFKALCTQNLPTPTIGATTATQAGKYFGATPYSGTSATQAIVNDGFQPDLIWLKARNAVGDNGLYDSIRGISLRLVANNTNAEASVPLDSFNSNGFSITSNYNNSGQTLIAWQWRGGGTGSTNTAGSITSTVSASTTSGFSIVTYTGTGSAGATVGHGLGAVPSMIIFKKRSGTSDWQTYHTSLGNANSVYLNLTNASAASAGMLNSTTPTSTLITLGTSTDTNPSTGTMVAYCFAPIAGYSAFGQYTGNGSSDGAFVYTGFRPAYVMIKRTTSGYDWWILDVARGTINAVKGRLYANATDVESTTYPYLDFLSNGFKLRDADGGLNASGEPYIYMCFASNPFKYSLAR